MAGSSFGKFFTVTTWGESHGKAVGAVVDGCPAGLPLSEVDIQFYLDQRRPGTGKLVTARQEEDRVEILSGIFEGKTTGTPISLMVRNQDHRSADYSEIASYYRPGHADYTFDAKYGFRDYRGGGRSSGRETIGRVAGGAIALKILKELGIEVRAFAAEIGGRPLGPGVPISEADLPLEPGNSLGGIIECRVTGLPVGLGEPVFDKLDAQLARGIMSIGAVKGVEIGAGFAAARSHGRENNDAFCAGPHGIEKMTNHAGGVLGGISDGSELIVRAAVKPTPSVSLPQRSVDRSGQEREITVKGRHDPVIVPRAIVVVQAMTALVLVDLLMENMKSRIDGIKKFYER
jgi:chorismate synthase